MKNGYDKTLTGFWVVAGQHVPAYEGVRRPTRKMFSGAVVDDLSYSFVPITGFAPDQRKAVIELHGIDPDTVLWDWH